MKNHFYHHSAKGYATGQDRSCTMNFSSFSITLSESARILLTNLSPGSTMVVGVKKFDSFEKRCKVESRQSNSISWHTACLLRGLSSIIRHATLELPSRSFLRAPCKRAWSSLRSTGTATKSLRCFMQAMMPTPNTQSYNSSSEVVRSFRRRSLTKWCATESWSRRRRRSHQDLFLSLIWRAWTYLQALRAHQWSAGAHVSAASANFYQMKVSARVVGLQNVRGNSSSRKRTFSLLQD